MHNEPTSASFSMAIVGVLRGGEACRGINSAGGGITVLNSGCFICCCVSQSLDMAIACCTAAPTGIVEACAAAGSAVSGVVIETSGIASPGAVGANAIRHV